MYVSYEASRDSPLVPQLRSLLAAGGEASDLFVKAVSNSYPVAQAGSPHRSEAFAPAHVAGESEERIGPHILTTPPLPAVMHPGPAAFVWDTI